jgi:hypothetical protein
MRCPQASVPERQSGPVTGGGGIGAQPASSPAEVACGTIGVGSSASEEGTRTEVGAREDRPQPESRSGRSRRRAMRMGGLRWRVTIMKLRSHQLSASNKAS